MKGFLSLLFVVVCVGCARTDDSFVQNDIKIVPPVTREGEAIFADGGTQLIKILDAEGKQFDIYVDYRLRSPTPGAIYLRAHPSNSNSVMVVDQQEFRRKIRIVK